MTTENNLLFTEVSVKESEIVSGGQMSVSSVAVITNNANPQGQAVIVVTNAPPATNSSTNSSTNTTPLTPSVPPFLLMPTGILVRTVG